MINTIMMANIVTTNLRIPKDDLALIKTIAASRGISVNEYIKHAIKVIAVKDQLGALVRDPEQTIYDFLFTMAKRKTGKPKSKFRLSDEDKAIYGAK